MGKCGMINAGWYEPLRRTTSLRLPAMALVLRVPDPAAFNSARGFAAWTGLTPRLQGGDEMLRRLLVLAHRTEKWTSVFV